jgi:hypothetical protein
LLAALRFLEGAPNARLVALRLQVAQGADRALDALPALLIRLPHRHHGVGVFLEHLRRDTERLRGVVQLQALARHIAESLCCSNNAGNNAAADQAA